MPPPPRRNIKLIESLEEHARDYQALLRVARAASGVVNNHDPRQWREFSTKWKETQEALKEVEDIL